MPFLTTDEVREQLAAIVYEDRKHANYERVVQHGHWCRQTMLGEQSKDVVVSYRTHETPEQQETRFRLYNSRTGEVGHKVQKLFYEVHRSDNVVNTFEVQESPDAEQLVKDLASAFDAKHDRDLREYLSVKYHHYNFYDPNAWLFIDYDEVDGELYTWGNIVPSSQVVNWKYKYGNLEYVVIKRPKAFQTVTGSKEVYGEHWLTWASGMLIEYIILPDQKVRYSVPDGFTEGSIALMRNGKTRRTYLYREYPLEGVTKVPARRIGYLPDPETNQETYISPMYAANKILKDLVTRKMEYDLSHACHGYFQKFQYVQKCQTCAGSGMLQIPTEINPRGTGGERQYTERRCEVCHGTGKMTHSSVQDIVMVTLPDDLTEIIPLQNLIYYAQIPEHLLRLQQEDIESAKRDVFSAIFSEHAFERSQVATTATENKLNWRHVYNALYPYAQGYSSAYTWAIKTISHMAQIPDDAIRVQHEISPDFSLATVDELLAQRLQAVTAKAPSSIINDFDAQITKEQHKGDPGFIDRMMTKQQFDPFSGKSEQERAMLASLLSSQEHHLWVAYMYYDQIWADIFFENPDIHVRPYNEQKEIYEAKLQEYYDAEYGTEDEEEVQTFDNNLTQEQTDGDTEEVEEGQPAEIQDEEETGGQAEQDVQ